MATRHDEPEDWERIEPPDLLSTDAAATGRIMALLLTAQGNPGENRESARGKKAAALLRKLVMPTILNRCRSKLWGVYAGEIDAVASMVFASHAFGKPFLADKVYKTWAESWKPERGPLIRFVSVCAASRCDDWLRSQIKKSSIRSTASPDAADGLPAWAAAPSLRLPANPEDALATDRLFRAATLALADMPAGAAADAIRARFLEKLSAAEYADREGITKAAASNRMKRGGDNLIGVLIERGELDEGFAPQPRGAPGRARRGDQIDPHFQKESGDEDA